MNLIGSRTEKLLREELIKSRLSLQQGDNSRLLDGLKICDVDINSSYVIDWVPEQGEDIYVLLISNACILTIEIPRYESKPKVLSRDSLETYQSNCSKLQRLKIMIAKDLLSEKT